ncbi:MAG: TolC family protein [Ferruginibacter sp.]
MLIIKKKLLHYFYWFTFSFLLQATTANAQDSTQLITLETALQKAMASNEQIQLANTDIKIARAAYKQTAAFYLPQVNFSYSAMSTNNALNAFGFKLQQETVKATDFNPDYLNNPGSRTDFMTKMQVNLPIYNPELIYLRKAAASKIEIEQFKAERTQDYIAFEIEKILLQLQMAYDTKKVLNESLQTANALYQFTNNRVEEGLLQKSDALNAKVWISSIESNLAEINGNIRNGSDYLSMFMGEQSGTIYKPAAITTATTIDITGLSIPANRADLQAMKKAIDATSFMIRSSKMKFRPTLNAFSAYQFNDKTATGFNASTYLAGIQLSWNIFNGNAVKNKIATQSIEKKRIEQELTQTQHRDQVELNKAKRNLETINSQVKSIRVSVENASEVLRILTNRYEQGLVNSTDVLLAQTQLSNQQLQLTQSQYQYNATIAHIKFLTANKK